MRDTITPNYTSSVQAHHMMVYSMLPIHKHLLLKISMSQSESKRLPGISAYVHIRVRVYPPFPH